MRSAKSVKSVFTLGAAVLFGAIPAAAQQVASAAAPAPSGVPAADTISPAPPRDSTDGAARTTANRLPMSGLQHIRANDQRGINVFEAAKIDSVPFTGFKLGFGAAFTQQFQGLGHSNTAATRAAAGSVVNQNQLIEVGHGFNNAVANAYMGAQLAKGIRVAMTGYLSSRHHSEVWIKDGYLLIDDSPIDQPLLNTVMQYVTVKAGHFEINYGDTHFRRTDNGNAMYNPLVGNYIMDAFTTQVGGEVYLRPGGRARGLFAMGAVTNGEVRGMTLNARRRSPAFLTKVGVDRQVTQDLRVRLTGSTFAQARASNQTLYNGDRAGSRYYSVLENTAATESAQAWSGAINPGMNEMHAVVVNPFVKFRGLELYGNFERTRGKQAAESVRRELTQNAVEGTYRFLGDRVYVSSRYNTVAGRLSGITEDVRVNRVQGGAGWFITPLILMKGEYVRQKYLDFPASDIRNGGKFNGFVVEGVVAF